MYRIAGIDGKLRRSKNKRLRPAKKPVGEKRFYLSEFPTISCKTRMEVVLHNPLKTLKLMLSFQHSHNASYRLKMTD